MNNHDPYHPDNMEDTTPELEQEYEDMSGPEQDFKRHCYKMADDWEPTICQHGRELANCEDCDEYEEQRGGLDQCLRCGRYCYGDELDKDQCHIKPCKNPAEY